MLWDAVPYSFVSDWLVDFGSVLEKCDERIDQEYFPIDHSITSQKRVWSPIPEALWPGYQVHGQIHFKYYTRTVAKDFPLPPIQVSVQVGSFLHWAEAGALVIQRL
jgi:hypothetical protein